MKTITINDKGNKRMNLLLKCSLSTLTAMALIALVSCSSTPLPPENQAYQRMTYKPGVPGGAIVETHTMYANVTDIDASNRRVTLVNSEGEKATVKCGPDIVNFDQIRVGDQLKVKVTEQLMVQMAKPGETTRDNSAGAVLLAPVGAKPGGVMAGTTQVTATISALDRRDHTATLRFDDGAIRTFRARSDVRLSDRRVGEQVTFNVTEVLAISMEKPQ